MLLTGGIEKNVYLPEVPRQNFSTPQMMPLWNRMPLPTPDYGLYNVPPEYNPFTPDLPQYRIPFLPQNFLSPQIGLPAPKMFNEPDITPFKTPESAQREFEEFMGEAATPNGINPLLIVGLLGLAYYVFNKKKKV